MQHLLFNPQLPCPSILCSHECLQVYFNTTDTCTHTSAMPLEPEKSIYESSRGYNLKPTCTLLLWSLTCTSVAAKTSVCSSEGAHFRGKRGRKFGFEHTETEYKTAEAGVRVSSSQKSKLLSLLTH